MSTQVLFDQFAYADRLKSGGFSDEQARASAEALRAALTETVATKTDLAELKTELKHDIASLRAATRSDIAELATKTEHTSDALRLEVRAMIADAATELTKEIHSAAYKALGAVIAVIGAFSVLSHFWK